MDTAASFPETRLKLFEPSLMKPSNCISALLLSLLACLPVPAFAQADNRSRGTVETLGEWVEGSIRIKALDRWFRIHQPRTIKAPAPAVVLLHGGTQSMRKIFGPKAGGARAWLDLADREGFVLIVPNGVNPKTGDTMGDNQNWNDLRPADDDRQQEADDVDFIVQLLDKTAREYGIDTKRVYVTGASNGGMMAYRLLIEAPERFAAAATFLAVLPDDLPDITLPGKATPLLIANGTKDPLVKWEGGAIRGQRGRMMSVLESRDWWIQANRADAKNVAEESLPDTDTGDGCRLYRSLYPATAGGAAVLFLKIDGGGHALPSRAHELPDTFLVRRLIGPLCRDAEGAEIAWRFMAQFKR